MKSQRVSEWEPVNSVAHSICAEHDAALIDRSDKGAYLNLTLGNQARRSSRVLP